MGDDEKTYGPFSSALLMKCVEQGRIHKETLVRRDGSERWIPADKINGLQNHLSVSTNTTNSRSTGHKTVQCPDESSELNRGVRRRTSAETVRDSHELRHQFHLDLDAVHAVSQVVGK